MNLLPVAKDALRSRQHHVITLEISSGQVYRGKLIEGMNFLFQDSLRNVLSQFPTSLPRRAFHVSATSRLIPTPARFIAEDNMNVQLKDITVTARDGRVSHLDQVYIRGSHVRFFIVPDMLRNAPMFRARGVKGRGVGMARGRATVNRARGQRGPRGG